MFRVDGNVDAFVSRVWAAQRAVRAKIILQLDDAPHGGASQVLLQNSAHDPWLAFDRGVARRAEFLVEELLRDGAILLPPTADGAHVVRAGRDDAEIGCFGRPRKGAARI